MQKSAFPYARANAIKKRSILVIIKLLSFSYEIWAEMSWDELSVPNAWHIHEHRFVDVHRKVVGCWCILCSPLNVQCFDAQCLWCAHESTCQRLKWHEASFLIHYVNLSFIHYNHHYDEENCVLFFLLFFFFAANSVSHTYDIWMWKWWRIYIL